MVKWYVHGKDGWGEYGWGEGGMMERRVISWVAQLHHQCSCLAAMFNLLLVYLRCIASGYGMDFHRNDIIHLTAICLHRALCYAPHQVNWRIDKHFTFISILIRVHLQKGGSLCMYCVCNNTPRSNKRTMQKHRMNKIFVSAGYLCSPIVVSMEKSEQEGRVFNTRP